MTPALMVTFRPHQEHVKNVKINYVENVTQILIVVTIVFNLISYSEIFVLKIALMDSCMTILVILAYNALTIVTDVKMENVLNVQMVTSSNHILMIVCHVLPLMLFIITYVKFVKYHIVKNVSKELNIILLVNTVAKFAHKIQFFI